MTAFEKLQELVGSIGGETYSPATIEDIGAAECRIGFPFPADLRAFYLETNGASLHDWMRELYPLSDLQSYSAYRDSSDEFVQITRTVSLRAESLVFFADILIDAPSYWICCDSKSPHFGQVFSDGDIPGWMAAGSFDRFVEQMAADIDNIFIGLDEQNPSQIKVERW